MSAYQRLIEHGMLRCGYTPWPILLDVDSKTGRLSGVFYDYVGELARVLDIRCEWVEGMAFGQMPDALNEGRIDIHSSGAWTNPIRGKLADNVIPVSYEHINAFVRADDDRFDDRLPDINDPKVR